MAPSPTSIANVVFDMGNVLLRWEPAYFSHLFADSDADAELIRTSLFESPEWPLLDAGAISEDTMGRIAELRLPEADRARLRPVLHRTFEEWDLHQRQIPQTNDLVRRLHDEGMGTYLLTNAGTRFARQRGNIPSADVMDGILVSAHEHLMKPDPAIYQLLCTRFGLRPETCLFVDDNPMNVDGAERAGMAGFVFTGDVEALERTVRQQA
ncbi:MAG: HAD family phosphatase [Atopobiaceae bacterium]|jgi:putative hydrolase of the HAD superfamily|nr:HAD family phosphatase [Atopobiaceae bacterium]MCH4180512.1 HAD family phosphatase [Atopobiaceae bacterium]MCH4214206.1 HAD family phosphatase [Atopobiaceae bacterium]MCH4230550.1 HAD family phosphatase [Atopobiaceae bacterium]MCH4275872.1 HAD family phosphatase [Atopobiaceae bacterium]